MARSPVEFTCSICGEELPHSDLSRDSLRSSGERNRRDAVSSLRAEDLVCQECANELADIADAYEDLGPAPRNGRNDYETFIFSGIQIDPACLQAYHLNY